MTSIINEFKIFDTFPQDIKENIKIFLVKERNQIKNKKNKFVICVTNDDKVFAFGEINDYSEPFAKLWEGFDNNYVLIIELCNQNIEQFFYFENYLFAKSSDNKIFGNLLFYDDFCDYLKPKRIEFFNDKNIIDISCGISHGLALSKEGLVYGWGEINEKGFNMLEYLQGFSSPILLNTVFGVEKRVKHIHCSDYTSVLVSFEGFVYILNPKECHLKYKITELSDINKIFLHDSNALVLRNDGNVTHFSETVNYFKNKSTETIRKVLRKSFKLNIDKLVDSHYFSGELIINENESIKTFDLKIGGIFDLKYKNAFEYFLFRNQSTFKTIYLKEKQIYFEDLKFDENSKLFIKTKQAINFDVEEYHYKYCGRNDSQMILFQFKPCPTHVNPYLKLLYTFPLVLYSNSSDI